MTIKPLLTPLPRPAFPRMMFALLLICNLFSSAATAGPISSQPTKNRTRAFKIAIGSHSGNIVYLQIDLAHALRYFEEEGLNIQLVEYASGAQAADALYRKQVDFSANSMDHAITMTKPVSVKMIASFTDLPTVTLTVRRDLRSQIRAIKDLKGRRLGVTSIGAGTHVLAASILASAGLSLKDVTVVPVGAGASLIRAVRQHDVDAAITTDPTTIQLLMDGDGSLLLDMVTRDETQRVFFGNYQFTGLLARATTINSNPNEVQHVVNAMVRANKYIHTHSAAEIAAVLPANIVRDRYVYIKSLEHSRASFSWTTKVDAQAVQNVIESLRAYGSLSSADHLNPSDYYDMQFVERSSKQ